MTNLDAEDVVVILLGLDILTDFTGYEMSKAVQRRNPAKLLSMQIIRQQIANARVKVVMGGVKP